MNTAASTAATPAATPAAAPRAQAAIGLDADQLSQLHAAIRSVAEHLKHHPNAGHSLKAWIKRQHQLRYTHDLPANRLAAVLEQLQALRDRARSHSTSLWALEKNFLQQALGIAWADTGAIMLEVEA